MEDEKENVQQCKQQIPTSSTSPVGSSIGAGGVDPISSDDSVSLPPHNAYTQCLDNNVLKRLGDSSPIQSGKIGTKMEATNKPPVNVKLEQNHEKLNSYGALPMVDNRTSAFNIYQRFAQQQAAAEQLKNKLLQSYAFPNQHLEVKTAPYDEEEEDEDTRINDL